jgi:predicted transcriptional regulator
MFGSLKISTPELTRTIYNSKIGKVDVADDENIQKWATVLGISEAELLISVEEFGSVIADIRRGRKLKAG